MGQQQTSVTTGWIVKRSWRDAKGKSHSKTISRLFHVEGAAKIYCDLARKAYTPIEGENEVVFTFTNDIGTDNLQERF